MAVSTKMSFILIPGTRLTLRKKIPTTPPDWTQPNSKLYNALTVKFPRCSIIWLPWSGRHNQVDRHEAAKKLATLIDAYRNDTDRIVLIGHSHGGNIALQAAHQVSLVPIELITLNTPFITERHQPEEASARRTANFILFFATLLLAVVAIVWLRSMPTSLVFIAGSVWICIINYLKLRLPDTLQGVVAGQKPLVEKIFSAPRVRKGSRCLVVIDKNDEIFAGARELKSIDFCPSENG
jgi:acetyl esterase/lipase